MLANDRFFLIRKWRNIMGMHRTGLIEFRDGEDNYQKDLFSHPDGSGRTTGSLVRKTPFLLFSP